MELRHILKPGWVWDGGCLNLRCNFADLNGGETYIINPGWAWDGAWVELRCNLWTWMEMRCDQDGGEMEIYGRRLRWGATWMGRRGESMSLHGGDTTWTRVRWDQDWAETNILRPEQVVMGLGWIWDSIIVTWMDVGYYPFFSVRHDLDRGETWMWWTWWNSDAALMKVRWRSMDLDGSLRWNLGEVGTWM